MQKNIRLLSILERLSLNRQACVKTLAQEYGVTIKSIQNDFNILSDYFADKLLKKGDCYFLLNQEHLNHLFKSDPKTTKQFLKLVSIVESSLYDKFITQQNDLLQALKFDSSPIYQIENTPYEHLQSQKREILEQLEEAIAQRYYINITYQPKKSQSFHYAHSIPIKILYLNENWYLIVLTTNDIVDNSAFKQLRINFISAIKRPHIEPKTFDIDNSQKLKAEQFLKNIQSAYSNMDKPTYSVLLKVSADVARYFKKKKYLKSQRVVEELKNGDIIVSFEVCNDMEVLPIVQRWIPHLQVIEPLRNKLPRPKGTRYCYNSKFS